MPHASRRTPHSSPIVAPARRASRSGGSTFASDAAASRTAVTADPQAPGPPPPLAPCGRDTPRARGARLGPAPLRAPPLPVLGVGVDPQELDRLGLAALVAVHADDHVL